VLFVVSVVKALSAEEATELVNNRKRWSAHLHAHSADLQNIIRGLAGHRCWLVGVEFNAPPDTI